MKKHTRLGQKKLFIEKKRAVTKKSLLFCYRKQETHYIDLTILLGYNQTRGDRMPETHALAISVRNERKALGESQEEFAEHCGLSTKTISNIENEREIAKMNTMKNIASYLGKPVSQLINQNNTID